MVNQGEVLQKPIKNKVDYRYADKEILSEVIGKSIPRQLIPDKKMTFIFGLLFLLSIIIALFQFPYSSFMTGSTEIIINIGYPWPFLILNPLSVDELPVQIINLILDLFLYLILAYTINIIINLTLNNPLIKSKEKIQEQPIIFKDRKLNIAEKVTEKVVENIE